MGTTSYQSSSITDIRVQLMCFDNELIEFVWLLINIDKVNIINR